MFCISYTNGLHIHFIQRYEIQTLLLLNNQAFFLNFRQIKTLTLFSDAYTDHPILRIIRLIFFAFSK